MLGLEEVVVDTELTANLCNLGHTGFDKESEGKSACRGGYGPLQKRDKRTTANSDVELVAAAA